MNDKRYYWLKLEENYFDLKIQKALRKLPSGADMLICYLKMQLKYLNTGGIIEFNNICNSISEEIALDIDEEEDLVKMTLAILTKWNVIEEENSNLFINEMQSRIGSKSDSALRVAKHREKQKMLHCNNDETKCNSIKEIDIEKEIDIRDISTSTNSNNNIYDFVEENFGRTLSPIEYEKISEWEDNELTRYAIKLSVLNGVRKINYIESILNNYKSLGIKTVVEAQEEEEKFKNKNKVTETRKTYQELEEEKRNEEIRKALEEDAKRKGMK